MTGPASTALAHVESDVRELLVRRELPLDEDQALGALVDEVVADYRDRYLDGGLPPLTEDEVDALRQRILGFGALTPLTDRLGDSGVAGGVPGSAEIVAYPARCLLPSPPMPDIEGHAFICYVREDRDHADRIQHLLQAAEIPYWRDTESLWPGEDWRQKIREAITQGAFAFIPIFTNTSVAKGVSGQNEELYLAAEEMRRRQPGVPWMIPVRFDDCELPKLRLAGGDTLDAIQRADLFGSGAEREGDRLVESVRRGILQLGAQPPQAAATPTVPGRSPRENSVCRRSVHASCAATYSTHCVIPVVTFASSKR